MKNEDVDSVRRYVREALEMVGASENADEFCESVRFVEESGSVRVPIPVDVDPCRFADDLAQLLGRKGYSQWDVWVPSEVPAYVCIDDKELD